MFANWTGTPLVMAAAGVLAYGIHELQEASIQPGLDNLMFDISATIPPDIWYSTLLKGVFNFQPNPSVRAAFWALRLTPVLFLVLLPARSAATPSATAYEDGGALWGRPNVKTAPTGPRDYFAARAVRGRTTRATNGPAASRTAGARVAGREGRHGGNTGDEQGAAGVTEFTAQLGRAHRLAHALLWGGGGEGGEAERRDQSGAGADEGGGQQDAGQAGQHGGRESGGGGEQSGE
ncbi:UNVERIFIED_CONTAM: hypothetical protein RKD50_000213 [Streptomyces canus]